MSDPVTNELTDANILKAIADGAGTFGAIQDAKCMRVDGVILDFRLIDRRLQALKRKHEIVFDHPGCDISKPKRWRILPKDQR